MKSLERYWYQSNYIVWLLLPLSGLYCFVTAFRKKLYQLNVKKSFASASPVIVVGNIVAGGSGKTPLLIALCEYLISKGFKPGVVSRGYGGSYSGLKQIEQGDSADLVGDEPLMIYQKTKVPVVVCADRANAVSYLIGNNDCNVVLSDDGLQHYRMQRDIEIAVIDSERRFGNGFCLPAGPLREPVSRLKTVDLVVYNGTCNTRVDALTYSLQQIDVQALDGSSSRSLSSFMEGKNTHAVAGIGNPQRFYDQLNQNGIKTVNHNFPDHHAYQQGDFDGWQNDCILMTENDAVKCRHLLLPNAWVINVQAEMSSKLVSKLDSVVMPAIR